MAQPQASFEPGQTSAPPLPPRNPLRETPYYQTRLSSFQAGLTDYGTTLSSPISQAIFEEIDRELKDTQQRLVSALYLDRTNRPNLCKDEVLDESMPETVNRMSNGRSQLEAAEEAMSDGENTSQASANSSVTQGWKRYSAYLGLGKLPAWEHEDDKLGKLRLINEAMAKTRGSFDASASMTTISSYDGITTTSTIAEENDARTDAWLEHGQNAAPLPGADRLKQARAAMESDTKSPSPLCLFPPTSPTTGKREYASPLSPMNNGRDAYGNYIPTNTRDYLTAQYPPTSPTLCPVAQNPDQQKPGTASRLRGGGGWWNTLGIGRVEKERLAEDSPAIPTQGISYCGTQAQIANNKNATGTHDHSPDSLDEEGGTSRVPPAIASVAMEEETATRMGGNFPKFEADGPSSQTSRPYHLEDTSPLYGDQEPHNRRQVRLHEPTASHAGTPLLTHQRIALPARAAPRAPPLNAAHSPGSGLEELDLLWDWVHPPRQRAPTSRGERPESPMTKVSYGARENKRWDKGPITGPPGARAPPPPPPPKGMESPHGSFVSTLPISRFNRNLYDDHPVLRNCNQQRAQNNRPRAASSLFGALSEYPPSPVDIVDDSRWDLQSLQLGESMSVVGLRRRQQQSPVQHPAHPLQGVTIRQGNQPTPEDIEAWQANAEARFRKRVQEIRTPYTTEVLSLDRARQLNQISQEQYKRQSEQNDEDSNRKLREADQATGYAILENEDATIEAIKTTDGYAICNNILGTTDPSKWQRLDALHRSIDQTQTAANITTEKPQRSSLEQGRHVLGKITRFILAAPSDPHLKTYSSHRPSDMNEVPGTAPVRVYSAMGGNGMNGLALAQNLDGLIGLWNQKNKKDKGKARATAPAVGVDRRDFALSGAGTSKPIGATAVNSNNRWTGTTTNASVVAPLRLSTDQAPNPSNRYCINSESSSLAGGTLTYGKGRPNALRRLSYGSNATIETHQTRGGDMDSLGDVYLPHERAKQVNMRGGGGTMKAKDEKKERKKNENKEKHPWRSLNHTEAMHFLG